MHSYTAVLSFYDKSWKLRNDSTMASYQTMVQEKTLNASCFTFNCGAFHLGVYDVFEL